MPRLHTGEEVDSDSEAWRHLCEARFVLHLPLETRQRFLEGVRSRRGQAEVERLLGTVDALRTGDA
jgi:hypothetical protein